METQTRRCYSVGNTEWKPRNEKSETDRRGIAASVAANNVFGNLTFDNLQDVGLNSDKLNRLIKLAEAIAVFQVEFALNTK